MRPLNSQFKRQQTYTQDKQKPINLEDSIREMRRIYPELTDQQLANRYEIRYGVRASRVLHMLAKQNQGGSIA